MKFFSVLMMAASVAAVAVPGNDWNQWKSSSCPAAQTVYKTEYQTQYQTKTDYQTTTEYKTEYQTQYQTKTDTQYVTATVTKECEKQQQTWGNWGGKGQ